jgi:hypothetical protein
VTDASLASFKQQRDEPRCLKKIMIDKFFYECRQCSRDSSYVSDGADDVVDAKAEDC